MCLVFQSEIKEAGGQIKPERSRATVPGELFAQAGKTGNKIKKYRKGMKVIRCVATFYSSFLLTRMTCCYGNNTENTCEYENVPR